MRTFVFAPLVVALILPCAPGLAAEAPPATAAAKSRASAEALLKAGDREGARRMLEELLALTEARAGDGNEDALPIMADLTGVYGMLDRYDLALPLAKKRLTLERARHGDAHRETLDAMSSLAFVYRGLGRYDAALRVQEPLLGLARRVYGKTAPETVDEMLWLARTYSDLGRYDDALPLSQQVVIQRVKAHGQDDEGSLTAKNNLAAVYADSGRYSDALLYQSDVLLTSRRLHGDRHPMTITAMGNLAWIYRSLGRTDEALPLEVERLRLSREVLGKKDRYTLIALNNLALTYVALGRDDDAQPLLEESVASRREAFGERHPETARTINDLAQLQMRKGKYEKAIELQEQSLAVFSEALGDRHPDTIKAMGNLAVIYQRLDRSDEAIKLEERRLAASRQLLGETHPDTLDAIANLAWSWENADQYDEAVALLPSYVAAVETMRARPGLTAKDRRSFFELHVPVYRSYARLLAQTWKGEESFRISELTKARTLLELTAIADASRAGLLPAEAQAELAALDADAKQVESELAVASLADARRQELEGRRVGLQGQYDKLQHELARRYPRYGSLLDVNLLDVSAGAAALADDTLFVSYLKTGDRWIVYLIDKTGLVTDYLLDPATTKGLRERVDRYREALQSPAGPRDPEKARGATVETAEGEDPEALAAKLGEILLRPLGKYLAKYRNIVVSPDGILATLPFEALPLEGEALVKKHDVTYVQSLSMYAQLQTRGEAYRALEGRKPLFAMGNPVYASTKGKQKLRWDELPGTARELEAVQGLFKIKPYVRKRASEQRLKALNATGELGKYRYLLFSAHGYLNLEDPALSALVLSQDDALLDEENDGYVSASEWPAYDLRSDMIVLSACETALGKEALGEGVMGLPYALYVAGNRNTVLTLWSIDDKASAEFIRRFFAKLKAGRREKSALNEVKREFLKDKKYSAPRYWAPFVMYGT